MSHSRSSARRLIRSCVALAVLLGLFACEGSSCSGPGYELGTGETLPEDKLLEPALQIRVTREGAEFLSQNGASVLQGLLGSSEGDWVDASEIVNQFVGDLSLFGLSASNVVAAMRLPNPDGLSIEFLNDPTRIHVEIDELHVRVEATVSTSSAACRVRGDVASGTDRRMFTLRNMVLDIELGTTPAGGFDVSTNVMSVEIAESGIEVVTDAGDPDYYCNLPECAGNCGDCEAVCRTAGFADDVANFFIEAFDSLVGTLAELVVNSVLSQVERLSGNIHPALILGSLLQDVYDAESLTFGMRGTDGGFQVLDRPDEFGPQGDLQVMLALGTAPAEVHPCVQPLSVDPTFPQAEPVPLSVPEGADLGVGIPEGFIDQLLWSLYASGALCLDVDSQTITELTDGTLNLSVGLVSLLLPGIDEVAPPDSPLVLTLRPDLGVTDFPLVRLGQDPEGGLIEVTLPKVAIGIYAEVDEEFVRLIEVSVTIDASVTPVVTGDGALAIGIERMDVTNVKSVYDELFADVELAALLDFVVELLGRALVGEELTLPLTVDDLVQQLLGASLSVEVLDISSTGAGWLAMSVGLGPSTAAPLRIHAETTLSTEAETQLQLGEPMVLTVPDDVEVQWSVDGLAWSGFRGGPHITVDSHLLQVPGTHQLRLRSRYQGRFRTLDPTPLELEITVLSDSSEDEPDAEPDAANGGEDPVGCSVSSVSSAGEQHVTPWLWLAVLACIGLISRRRRWAVLAAILALGAVGCSDDPKGESVECESDRDCPQGQLCGCNGTCSFPTRCATNADCCGGRSCADGICEASLECREDGDCSDGLICTDCQCQRRTCADDGVCGLDVCQDDGFCRSPGSIPCDGACEEAEACLVERDVCVARQNFCPQLTCPPGEQLVVESSEGLLGDQCSFEGITCGCRSSPPLPPPRPGGWVSAAMVDEGVAVAAYEPHYGDLLLAVGTSEADLDNPEFVDGVPDIRPTSDPAGPRGGIGLPGPDVGKYISAVSAGERLWLASYDATAGALKVTSRSSTERTFVVDSEGDAGRYADIAILEDGRPVIAYQVQNVDDTGAGRIALRVAAGSSGLASQPEDFVITEVDGLVVEGLDGGCGCVTDQVCIAGTMECVRPAPPSDCEASCELGSKCIGGVCEEILPAPQVDGSRRGTGVEPDVIPLGGLQVAIPFYRPISGELAVARGNATGPLSVDVLDAGDTRAGFGVADTGRSPAGAADDSGLVHLAYVDEVSGSLMYAQWDPATGNFQREVAELGQASNPPRRIGGLDLALGADGTVYIAYQDATLGALHLLTGRSGMWSDQTLDETDVSGFSPSLVTAGGELYVAFGRLRRTGLGALERELGLVRIP